MMWSTTTPASSHISRLAACTGDSLSSPPPAMNCHWSKSARWNTQNSNMSLDLRYGIAKIWNGALIVTPPLCRRLPIRRSRRPQIFTYFHPYVMAFLCCDPVQIRISVNAEIFHNLRHRVMAVLYLNHKMRHNFVFYSITQIGWLVKLLSDIVRFHFKITYIF